MLTWTLLMLTSLALPCWALDNGLVLPPPMAWLSWERFRCNRDCINDQANCIGEWLLRNMTDLMVSGGYRDAGYEYVMIDDCWFADTRAADGQLQPNPVQFPSGMKALGDYIHSKGLKFGIYEDYGTKTCAGYPGSEYYMQMDAQTFADWGVDYLKLDNCNAPQYKDGYPPVAFFLQKTGRPIVLSCEYPLYEPVSDYRPVAAACNLARNFKDMQDSWDSVVDTINFYGKDEGNFSQVAGPGYFNDPDMLVVGDFGLSDNQERVQMGMWAIMASPLIMSVDLRDVKASSKALLLNKHLIAINQDKLGIQGTRVSVNGKVQIWRRPLSNQAMAFAFLNFGTAGVPEKVSTKLADLGLKDAQGYRVTDAFTGDVIGNVMINQTFTMPVNPTGIFMGVATPLNS